MKDQGMIRERSIRGYHNSGNTDCNIAVQFLGDRLDAARRDSDELLAALRAWLDAEKGCDNPACNIGGGLCANCSVLAEDCKSWAAKIAAKYKKGGE